MIIKQEDRKGKQMWKIGKELGDSFGKKMRTVRELPFLLLFIYFFWLGG